MMIWMCSYLQGEGSLPTFKPDITDRARDGGQGPAAHRSHQTAQQQVSPLWFIVGIDTSSLVAAWRAKWGTQADLCLVTLHMLSWLIRVLSLDRIVLKHLIWFYHLLFYL